MLYDFLVISLKNEAAERIKTELELNRLYRVRIIDRADVAIENLKTTKVDCVIFNLETYTAEKTTFAENLRQMGYQFPIITFASYVQPEALEALKKIKRTVLIEKPYESKDVWGITEKMVQGKKVGQRIFRRFYTDQQATLEKSNSIDKHPVHIFNMSKGGAYIESENQGSFMNGEILRLTVPLEKMAKNYVVDVEVVWTSPSGYWQGKPAIGVRFIKPQDVYRNLINKL